MKKYLLLVFFFFGASGFAIAQSTLYATDAATSITSTSAISGGQVNIADNWITEVGLCWSTTTNPTTANTKVFNTIAVGVAYHGYAFHSMNITGLTCGTTYYVRSYAISSSGTTGYGAQISFTTPSGPSVTTTAISSVTTTTATSGGSISCAGAITQKGVVWSTATNPTTANSSTNNGTGTAAYGSSLTGLSPNTKYYVRAYVIQGGITYYGNEITFKTALPAGIVSPYSLTPEWYFGVRGGLRFPSGDYPSSASPTAVDRPAMTIGNEASTSLSYRDKSIAVYSNSLLAFNAASTNNTQFIRDFRASGDNTCAGSSTGGSVTFPKPNNVDNEFYLILANDLTSGACQGKGDNRYALSLSAGQVVAPSGPTLVLADANASESIVVGSDGDEGYWVVAHDKSSNQFYKWHYTKAGAVTGPITQAIGLATSVPNSQATLKFSPCQDKIAYSAESKIQVFAWDRTTGTIGTTLLSVSGAAYSTRGGLEFSEDGSQIYFSDLSFSDVYQIDISSGTLLGGINHKVNAGDPAGVNSWSMQMGPDMNIYTSPQVNGSTFVNRISNNNSYPPTVTKVPLTAGASTYQGLVNLSWLSPQKTNLTATVTATCNVYDFNFDFKNYFNSNVTVSPLNATIDFGDGSAVVNNPTFPLTHTFPSGSGGPYNVVYTFYDLYCNQQWTATTSVTVTCPAPVELITFNGVANLGGVDLVWKTAMELNNDYFDLQRSSDGIHFTSIAHINGAGSSNRTLTYNYRDNGVSSGVVYYKLAQHDFDGTISYSKIISVHFDKLGGAPILIAPNPFSNSFTVSKIFDEAATVSVYDVYGRLLEQKATSAAETSISLGESLANGSYIVQYLTGSNNYTMHIEKK